MSNLIRKAKEIEATFDEMIATWEISGLYDLENVKDKIFTDLEALKKIELFFLDIESVKTPLFLLDKHDFNYIPADDEEDVGTYCPTQYAKKWNPFDVIFREYVYRNRIEDFIFLEVSFRFNLFFEKWNANLLRHCFTDDDDPIYEVGKVAPDLLKNHVKMKHFNGVIRTSKKNDVLPKNMSRQVNIIVEEYKKNLANAKLIKNIDSVYTKKKKNYIKYINDLLLEYNALYAISINFFFDLYVEINSFSELKTKFLNRIRSVADFKIIAGYLGTWEFAPLKGYYFRIVFFVPSKSLHDPILFEDAIKNYWAEFSDDYIGSRFMHRFIAESCSLSNSISSLRKSNCLLTSSKSMLYEAFVNSVINYTTLADKFFFQAHIQILIYMHEGNKKKIPVEDGLLNIKNFNFNLSFSRSFRGHIKSKSRI